MHNYEPDGRKFKSFRARYCQAMPSLLSQLLIALFGSLIGFSVFSDSLDKAVEETLTGARESAVSQRRIEALDDETRVLFIEYRDVTRRAKTSNAYVERLRGLIADQENGIRRREADISGAETFERFLFPAMERMTEALDQFVRADLPFLPTERRERVARIKELMSRSDVAASEKFRQLMEAYQTESDYGRTIGAYRGGTVGENEERVVDFLRIGRNLLVYQSLDGKEIAMWDAVNGAWRPLDGSYRADIRRGLRMARRQAVPDLLILPMAVPVAIESLR